MWYCIAVLFGYITNRAKTSKKLTERFYLLVWELKTWFRNDGRQGEQTSIESAGLLNFLHTAIPTPSFCDFRHCRPCIPLHFWKMLFIDTQCIQITGNCIQKHTVTSIIKNDTSNTSGTKLFKGDCTQE